MSKWSKKRKWLTILLSVFGAFFIGISIYAYTLYSSVERTIESIHEPIERVVSEKRVEEVQFEEQDPISVLILGVDERKNDRGRSDTMIVMTVNPSTKSMQMVSIPRDTRTEIIGRGFDDKINHAYAFGGVEMAMDTVENFLDIPIDYFVKVNMEGFQDIVDAVGGVTVNNGFAFDYSGYTFNEGEITLDGKKALAYSRMRYEDPRGDFGRQDRQKQIIQAVIEEGASFSSISKFDDMLSIIGQNVKTNLTLSEMFDIQKNYKDARHSLEKLQVSGSGQKINGIYYLIVPEETRIGLSTKLKEHLNVNNSAVTKKN
ncbi:cell envelope-related function transcriptional attenuator common domain-containing protein [Litchfieldia salsa]|uniref:Polyisoprenyl-teichoic acid--peptidoglycan teichoic acid transferase TagU n=1 Tax=Litchfieldia salsa TaxID=930152 RepID=A0A1H0WW02_9BACI|nr:cell envelope-related function transcriptional attenuator common domain-containing protein [Litchfieldia salsa]